MLPTELAYSGGTFGIGENSLAGRHGQTVEVFSGFKLQALDPDTFGEMTPSRSRESEVNASDLMRAFLRCRYVAIRRNIESSLLKKSHQTWQTLDDGSHWAFQLDGYITRACKVNFIDTFVI